MALFGHPPDDRCWHFADKPTAQGFVAYWGNNGHRLALALNGSVAN
jgi:hypothetical protein